MRSLFFFYIYIYFYFLTARSRSYQTPTPKVEKTCGNLQIFNVCLPSHSGVTNKPGLIRGPSMTEKLPTFLTLFLLIAATFAFFSGAVPATYAEQPASLTDGCKGILSDDQIVVYYFHRKFRCPSCLIVESTLHETLDKYFSDEFTRGRLAVCVVNIDEMENKHYIEDFQILFNSVIVVEKRGGASHKYKNLEKVWDIYDDKDATTQLFKDEIEPFLTGS